MFISASKSADAFRICRDLQIPKAPVGILSDQTLGKSSAELRDLLGGLALVRACKKEIRALKNDCLKRLDQIPDCVDLVPPDDLLAAVETLPLRHSSITSKILEILDSDIMTLQNKALQLWAISFSSETHSLSAEDHKAFLCENPVETNTMLTRMQELWETYLYKETSQLLRLLKDAQLIKEAYNSYCDSDIIKLTLSYSDTWLHWHLNTACGRYLPQLYAIGINLIRRLSVENHFKECSQILTTLHLRKSSTTTMDAKRSEGLSYLMLNESEVDSEELVPSLKLFYEFAQPLYSESIQMVAQSCRLYFQALLKRFLGSLGGAHVLLRLQTSRKMKIDKPVECLMEFEDLARETRQLLGDSPSQLAKDTWINYAKAIEGAVHKSSQEIMLQHEASRTARDHTTEYTSIQQLILNSQRVEQIFREYCPQEFKEVAQIISSLIRKLQQI